MPSGVVIVNHNVNYPSRAGTYWSQTRDSPSADVKEGRKVMGRLSTFDCFIGGQTYKPTVKLWSCGFCLLASITLHILLQTATYSRIIIFHLIFIFIRKHYLIYLIYNIHLMKIIMIISMLMISKMLSSVFIMISGCYKMTEGFTWLQEKYYT